MAIMEARPPFVTFKTVPVENRNKSISAGHLVYDNVDMAYVTQAGSKDTAVKIAPEWIEQLKRRAFESNGPEGDWNKKEYGRVSELYKLWKSGQELPEDGFPLRMCMWMTPGEIETCIAANVRTLEALAGASEQALAAIGMGARALKDKAQLALQATQDRGKSAGEIESLRAENADLKTRLEALEAAHNVKRGRPRKSEEATVT